MYDYHNGLIVAAPGVVAVVGVAVRPQAGLVLPGGPRRRDHRGDLRRRQPRHLVAGRPGAALRERHGVPPAQPGAGPDRDRLRAQWIPWARIDRAAFQYHYYTALPFVVAGPRLLRRRAVARCVGEDLAARPPRRGRRDHVARPRCGSVSRPLCAFVGVESVNPGSQACPAVIPELRADGADGRARGRGRSSACSSSSARSSRWAMPTRTATASTGTRCARSPLIALVVGGRARRGRRGSPTRRS